MGNIGSCNEEIIALFDNVNVRANSDKKINCKKLE
jgi:hypothetical protein